MPEIIPANVDVRVVVARSQIALNKVNISRPVIAVFPDKDIRPWNDFGRNYLSELYVMPIEGEPLRLHMRLMFKDATRSVQVFTKLFEAHGDVFSIAQVQRPFVSLIPNIDDYRQLIEALGFDVGVSALRRLCDAIVIRSEGVDAAGLDLINSEDFHIGILRADGAYATLRRAARHFRRDFPAPVDDAAIDFTFSARLRSADNPYAITFEFTPDALFRDRTSVLIGRNGAGKTQVLKAIVDGLHGGHSEGFAPPHFLPTFRPARVLVFSSVPTDPFPRSIGAWHGIDYEYFAVNAVREDGTNALLSALVTCKRTNDADKFGPNRDMSRLDVIKEALDQIGLWRRLHLPLQPPNGEELPGVLLIDGQHFFPIDGRLNELNGLKLVHRIDWQRDAVVLDDQMKLRDLSSG